MLQLDSINRSYGDHQVLHDVGFSAGRGRLTGFVGGNGAGKTTTMRIILGVLNADSGTVVLDGEPVDAGSRRRFGYMPEERGLYPKMSVLSQVSYLARLHGFDREVAAERAERLLERLGLAERRNDPLQSLSLGNQQRVQIAAALVHGPDVLVLDEPFSGLDPMAVDVVLDVLTEQARNGAIVLFSSHQLDVVERLCDDIVIIGKGRILAAGETEGLREQHGTRRYELLSDADLGWVREQPGVQTDSFEAGRVIFRSQEPIAQQILSRAVQQGAVERFSPILPSLSEIFKGMSAYAAEGEDTPR
jgi:ABC-2 type transport system ATP-binding protein